LGLGDVNLPRRPEEILTTIRTQDENAKKETKKNKEEGVKREDCCGVRIGEREGNSLVRPGKDGE